MTTSLSSYTTSALILGAGPAGNTAAIYTARAALSPIVLAGSEPGGQLMGTTDVENYPGFRAPVQGPWLMDEMIAQAKACGADYRYETARRVDFSKRPYSVWTEKAHYVCQTVIIATGAEAKWLNLPSETFFRGYGVSSCAVCDGFFFRDKEVAVVGGGNTAVEDALYLSRHAKKVTLIHRRDTLRADQTLQARLKSTPSITPLWNHTVTRIEGTEEPRQVTRVIVKDVVSGEESILPLSGLFVAIGHSPNTSLFKEWLPLDDSGYVDTHGEITPIPGVFVAGDVQDKEYRQAITAAGSGCRAALNAERFLTYHQ
jgi:thioredoxin reductase (NADPH)